MPQSVSPETPKAIDGRIIRKDSYWKIVETPR